MNHLSGRLTRDVLDESYRGEPDPQIPWRGYLMSFSPSVQTTMLGLAQHFPTRKHCECQRATFYHHTPTDLWVLLLDLCTKCDPVYCYHGRSLRDWGEWGEEGKWSRTSPQNYGVRFLAFEVFNSLYPRVKICNMFFYFQLHCLSPMRIQRLERRITPRHNSFKAFSSCISLSSYS